MALPDPIKIEGLAEFSRNLKKLNADLPKVLRIANNEAANLIASRARAKVPQGPGKGGHAASSVKAASTRTEGRVKGGGKRYAYYPWLDFGGHVGKKRSVRRPFIKTGRYIFDTYEDNRKQVEEVMTEALIDVARQAGVEVED